MRKPVAVVAGLLVALASAIPAWASPDELVVGMGSYNVALNPYKAIYSHEMQVFTGLYEGLCSYHPETLEPVPAQAESWERSKDGKTWTFRLRKGIVWSDGSPVTAADYVDSWMVLLDPLLKSDYAVFFDVVSGAKAFRTGKSKDRSSVGFSAPDDRTLVIRLENPASYLAKLLCHSSFVPVHRSLRGKRTWQPADLVTNGPYILESATGTELVLRKSVTYWDAGEVAIPSIRILLLDDEIDATARFNQGEIHWLTDSIDLDTLLLRDTIQYAPMFATSYYLWNASRRPWNDHRLRRALALLVPWDEIRSADNYNNPTSSLILPFAGYEKPPGIEAPDPEEAARLLAEAGYEDPSTLPAVTFLIPDFEMHKKNAGIMKAAWEAVGIKVEITTIPGRDFSRASRQLPYTISYTSWIGDFADPIAFLQMWTSDSSLNESGYKNPEFDALIAASMLEEGRKRLATLAKAEGILLSDAALMPTNHMPSLNLVDTDFLVGWYANALDVHPFKSLSFGKLPEIPNVALAPRSQTR